MRKSKNYELIKYPWKI